MIPIRIIFCSASFLDRWVHWPTTALLSVLVTTISFFAQPACAQIQKTAKPAQIDFRRDIRPILSDKCFFCHGPDPKTREAGLRLDIEEDAKEDLGGYQAIHPGNAAESEAIVRIESEDEDERMPPIESDKKLSSKEIELIKAWINQGAGWASHWAYEKPKSFPASLPKPKNATWARSSIDRLVLYKLEKNGLSPNPAADPATLIRRLYFDLVGLPPTPQQVQAFVADPTDQRYQKIVDELLRSSHFGERMAIYWLDLVRYADTVGYHGDQVQNISPYRDWVIHAFNQNMPFDQFTREQLAGDLLPNPTQAQKIASGYNRLLQTTHEGGLQPKEYRAIYAADRVRNVSAVWMGATVGCAQCHDHKYDPYTSKDFYALSAFFADVDDEQHFKVGTNANPTRRPPEIDVQTELHKIRIQQQQDLVKELTSRFNQVSDDREKDTKQSIEKRLLSETAKLENLQKLKIRTMITVPLKEPRPVRVLPRGNWLDDSGPLVQPSVPSFLPQPGSNNKRLTRLDLANWLVAKDSPVALLTSRVMVNRFWYLMFGRGLAADLDDFGGQGVPPSHPELLDYLSHRFVDSNWDIKAVIREIVTSQAYRQSSTVSQRKQELDPENQYFSRQGRYRLSAEMVRDQALMLSGLLVDELGGPSAKPYQPAGYYRHLNFPQRKYRQHDDDQQWRRGVYVHWQRQFLLPTFKALDAPTREECTAQRPRSNTPIAALSLLNDPSFVEASRAFAERVLTEGGKTPADKIQFAFQWATGRNPSEPETKILRQLFEYSLQNYRQDPTSAAKLIATGNSKPDTRLDPVKLAAWTAVCRALFNLNETITRN